MVDLIECGAVDNTQKGFNDGVSICSFTMGSRRLYDFLDDNPMVLFKSSTYSMTPTTIGRNNKFVSINATLEMDLTGQARQRIRGPGAVLRLRRPGRDHSGRTNVPPAASPFLPCTPLTRIGTVSSIQDCPHADTRRRRDHLPQ